MKRFGISFDMFCRFISDIKSGKNHIIFGPGYLVISNEAYRKLLKEKKPHRRAK
jgi:hypothetical protein